MTKAMAEAIREIEREDQAMEGRMSEDQRMERQKRQDQNPRQ